MATGPEHYRKAEELLDAYEDIDTCRPERVPIVQMLLQAADTHATLALAAATALRRADPSDNDRDDAAWISAASAYSKENQ